MQRKDGSATAQEQIVVIFTCENYLVFLALSEPAGYSINTEDFPIDENYEYSSENKRRRQKITHIYFDSLF